MAHGREPEPLPALRALIVASEPALAGAAFRLAGAGWDSTAVLVDERLVFRFPGDADVERALRREARLLAALRPRLTLAVPDLRIVEGARPFSRHAMIPGGHLLPAGYAALTPAERARLAGDLARFFAELHALDPGEMRAAGAGPVEPWLPPDEIARRAWPVLPLDAREAARATLDVFAALGPDPHGEVFGHFDAHGWNMAWDARARRLNGVFDFGDAGIGPLHQEFVQTSLVSPDLTRRAADAYEGITGRAVDRGRVRHLTGAHLLWELAEEAGDAAKAGAMAALVERWFAGGADALTRGG